MSEPQTMAPELDPVKMAELLQRMVAGERFEYSYIREADPYSAAPEDLVHGIPGTDRGEGKGVAWYFCWPAEWHGSAGGGSSSKRKRKVAAGGETRYWHPETGKQAIIGTDRKSVGAYKRTLSYMHKTKNPPGTATAFKKKRLGWSMLEIWLDDPVQGLVLCKLYRTQEVQANPETSTETSVPGGGMPCPALVHANPETSTETCVPGGGMPCPALAPAPLGAKIQISRVAIVRNGSAAGAAVTLVIDLCGSSAIQPTQRLKDLANNVRGLESPGVVVSAMGNTTNTILMAACKALRCDPEKICEIHEVMLIKELYLRTTHELGLEASTALGSLDLLERQLRHVAMTKKLTFLIRDYLVSLGEITSTEIFYDYLNKLEGTLQVWKLHAIATSGRGSTNLTATTIDIALDSREIQVWKDVDGIFSCDPKVCADATLVPCLTFDEAAELSDFAEQSMKQAMEYGRSIRVMNPYNPLVRGTVITETRDTSESALTSISLKSNITVLDIKSNRMLFQIDLFPTALSKFQHFEYLGISVDCKVTLDGKMTLTLIPSGLLSKELIKLELDNVVEELQKIAEVHRLEDKSVIFLIGNAQKSSSIQQRALSVLWRINAEVYKFWQESSKVMKASLVVDRSRAKDCVQALHSAFFEKGLVSQGASGGGPTAAPLVSSHLRTNASIHGTGEKPNGVCGPSRSCRVAPRRSSRRGSGWRSTDARELERAQGGGAQTMTAAHRRRGGLLSRPPSSSTSTHELGAAHLKRPAGRTKFKETRHPVYRGVRRRGSAGRWVCEVRVPGKRGERFWLSAARAHDAAMLALRGCSASVSALAGLNFADSAWLLAVPPWLADLADVRRAAIEGVAGFMRREAVDGAVAVVPVVDEVTDIVSFPSSVHNADRLFEVPDYSALDLGGGDMFELDMSGQIDLDTYYAGLAEGMLLEPPPTPYWENRECGGGDAALCCPRRRFGQPPPPISITGF